jgi:hypothetical protein
MNKTLQRTFLASHKMRKVIHKTPNLEILRLLNTYLSFTKQKECQMHPWKPPSLRD